MEEHEVIEADTKEPDRDLSKNRQILLSWNKKRGVDVVKINYILGREQERDLNLIFRIDQVLLFVDELGRKKIQAAPSRFQRNPGDPPLLQALWEAHQNYVKYINSDDHKVALAWFKEVRDIIERAHLLRREAMDRMLEWKRMAEEKGKLHELSTEDLERLAAVTAHEQ